MSTSETHTKVIEGHPIHTYFVETDLIHQLLEELNSINPKEEFQKFYNVFNHLATVERRFERKENQLFPFLEQKGWTGPSRNMGTPGLFINGQAYYVRQSFAELAEPIAELLGEG